MHPGGTRERVQYRRKTVEEPQRRKLIGTVLCARQQDEQRSKLICSLGHAPQRRSLVPRRSAKNSYMVVLILYTAIPPLFSVHVRLDEQL